MLKGSWVLKVLALLFAIVTYIFIQNELYRHQREKEEVDPSYKLIRLTSKSLPVKVRLATSAPDGYRVLADQVKVVPENLVVIGPEALLEGASSVETALIDLSESTKTVTRKIPIESVAGIPLSGPAYNVEVTVPIEKIPEIPVESSPAFDTIL